eukprot:SRR837773.16118.p2 GENE.SRR837773.16118~~SRR837773.16118.p2  ORF type:complete len:362 (-),score=95.28 SRR837773.16118:12-1037(-)
MGLEDSDDRPTEDRSGALPKGTVSSTELASLPPPPMALDTAHQVQAPAAKRRRLKGVDTPSLARLLSGLHSCLQRMLGKGGIVKEVPVHELEDEFELHWRLRFNARAVGEPNTAAFLRRFPQVFKVRNNGVHIVVAPATSPDFTASARSGLERGAESKDSSSQSGSFVLGVGEQVAALTANLVAEERKAANAPLPFQFASYEVVHDLFARLRDGGSREEMQDLLAVLLDPKPQFPSREPHFPVPDDRPGGDGPPGALAPPPGSFGDFPGPPMGMGPPGMPPMGMGPPGMPGMGMPRRGTPAVARGDGRGRDGRNLCRQFQSGHCSYGDSCKFAHEIPGGYA